MGGTLAYIHKLLIFGTAFIEGFSNVSNKCLTLFFGYWLISCGQPKSICGITLPKKMVACIPTYHAKYLANGKLSGMVMLMLLLVVVKEVTLQITCMFFFVYW